MVIEAFRTYGMGRHKAGLNIGNCFSYAIASATGHPLLFKGDGFGHTDILAALTRPP
jgi:ribonuclease VapC